MPDILSLIASMLLMLLATLPMLGNTEVELILFFITALIELGIFLFKTYDGSVRSIVQFESKVVNNGERISKVEERLGNIETILMERRGKH